MGYGCLFPQGPAPTYLLPLISFSFALTPLPHLLGGDHLPPCGEGKHPRASANSSEPTTPSPIVCPSFRISQVKGLEPLGKDIKEILKCENL